MTWRENKTERERGLGWYDMTDCVACVYCMYTPCTATAMDQHGRGGGQRGSHQERRVYSGMIMSRSAVIVTSTCVKWATLQGAAKD